MKYPEHILEQIRQQVDIVDVVGETVALRQRGRNFIGLCPFHGEKTPSFNVSPDKGIFKCFGCGKGGNVFTFLTDYHKMTFPEAIKELAARAGIVLPESGDEDERDKANRYDLCYKAMQEAGNFYFRCLHQEQGMAAREYLRKRGFGEALIKDFGLGYAPDAWDATMQELKRLGFTKEIMLDAGLLVANEEKDRTYDRFRDRLMFPIQNAMGKVIGFGARIMSPEAKGAKYINSPQSLIYDKSKALYGIYQAKDAMRRHKAALLVEGYADVLSLHQAGFANTIASSGTALTVEQLQRIKRYCPAITIVYDADSAGANAAMKGMDLALREGLDVRVLRLPNGHDPDTFVQEHGAKSFEIELKSALSFVDFKCEVLKERGEFATPEKQAGAVRSIVESVAEIPDHIKRDLIVRSVAARFTLPEELLYAELSKILRERNLKLHRRRNAPPPTASREGHGGPAPHAARGGHAEAGSPEQAEAAPHPEEVLLLKVAVREPRALPMIAERLHSLDLQFESALGGRLFPLILTAAEKYNNPLQYLLDHAEDVSDAEKQALTELSVDRESPSDSWKRFKVEIPVHLLQEIEDALVAMQLRKTRREIEEVQLKLKSAAHAETQTACAIRLQELFAKRNMLEEQFKNDGF